MCGLLANAHHGKSRRLLLGLLGLLVFSTVVPAQKVIWTDGMSVYVGNQDGSGPVGTLFDSSDGLDTPYGVVVDVEAGKLYVADDGVRKILVGSLDGSGTLQNLFVGLGFPQAMAIDVAGGKLYWVDDQQFRIVVGNLDGSGTPTELYSPGIGRLRGIAVDGLSGKVYWSTNQDGIQIGNADGSGLLGFLHDPPGDSGGTIQGIALDVANGKIYWCDISNDKIMVGNLDGSGAPVELYGESGEANSPYDIALDPDDNEIFWVDNSPRRIVSGNLSGTGPPNLLYDSGFSSPLHLTLIPSPPDILSMIPPGAPASSSFGVVVSIVLFVLCGWAVTRRILKTPVSH